MRGTGHQLLRNVQLHNRRSSACLTTNRYRRFGSWWMGSAVASTPSTPEARAAPGRPEAPAALCVAMSGLSRMPFLGLAPAGPSARSGCAREAHDLCDARSASRNEAPLRARFTSPCDRGVRQSARLKTRQSQRRADLGPVIRRSMHDLRSGSTKSDAAGSQHRDYRTRKMLSLGGNPKASFLRKHPSLWGSPSWGEDP